MIMKMVRSTTFLCILIAALLLPGICLTEGIVVHGLDVVHTQQGDVSGIPGERYPVTVFKGIPYAAPPVGDLRWAEPQDHEPWDGVLVCDTYAPAAIQPNSMRNTMVPGSDFYPAGMPKQSEDCLYLNITTPAVNADEKLPVMVWFHGGGLKHGYSWQVPFDGEGLASKGVIVVTVGHRLGVFGFLALPQLSADSGYHGSGNYGLMDCIKSVQWVHENIAAFGGDPERITVFGQSGGSVKAAVTVAAPQTQGMIAGYINQSAFPLFDGCGDNSKEAMATISLEEAEALGLEALDAMGVSRDATVEELRALSVKKVNRAAMPFSVTIDNKYVTDHLSNFFLSTGNLNGIPSMSGWVYGEHGSYGASTAEELFSMIRAEYGDALADQFNLEQTMPITNDNIAYYNTALRSAAAMDELRLFAQIKSCRNEQAPSFLYSFGRITPNKTKGWHSGELWYVFNNLGYSFEGMDPSWQPEWQNDDYLVADQTAQYWTNFAKYGDPNGEGLPYWPAAESVGLTYQYIDTESNSAEELTSFDQMVIEYYKIRYHLQ